MQLPNWLFAASQVDICSCPTGYLQLPKWIFAAGNSPLGSGVLELTPLIGQLVAKYNKKKLLEASDSSDS